MIRPLLALALTCLTLPAAAQETRGLAPGTASPPATVDQLGWLAGSWRGEGYGGPATEVYSAPEGGQISGHFVQQDGKGGVAFYEIMQIVPRGGSLVYRLRHFNYDLTGWEDAKAGKAVEFPLVKIEGDTVWWNGMTMRREGADAMVVWVRIDGEGGAPDKEIAFRYRRTGP